MSIILPLILFGLSLAVAQEEPADAEAPAEAPTSATPAPGAEPTVAAEPPAGVEAPVVTPAEALGPYDTIADPPVPAPEPVPALPVIGAGGAAPVDLTEPPAGVVLPEPEEDDGFQPSERRVYADGRPWRNGMPLLWVYSCAAGSATGMALGGIVADTSSGTADEGVLAGFYLGGGAGALGIGLLHPDEISMDETMLVASSGILGGWAGAVAGFALIPPDADFAGDRIVAAGILGAAAGTAVGGLVRPHAPPARAMLMHDLSTFVGVQVGGGIADIAELDYSRRQARMGLTGLGGLAFLGTSLALVNHDAELDPGVIGLHLGHGAWIGMWAPFVLRTDPDPLHVLGGTRVGLGAGYLAGVLLSPHMELHPRNVLLQVGGIAAGNAVGAGIPLALGYNEEPRWVAGPMLAGSVAGQVAGLALAPHYEVEGSDALLMGTIETWSLYQAVGWGAFADLADPDLEEGQAVGMGLTIAGGGTIIAATLAPLADFTPAEAALVGSGGVWGTWYGAWGGHLAGLDAKQVWLTTLITGNAGLIGAGAVAGAAWDPGWRQVGLLDSVGLLGGTVGAMFGVIASPDLDTVATASLVGSTAGLVTGGILARKIGPGDPERSHVLLVPLPRWNLPVRAQVSAAPWLDDEGGTGALVSVNVVERPTR